ncbi:CPBP family intramembrane glutamic endopeptidase [Salinibacterium hongtaonis]|uniref:CPBP family intramembrane metalloprotease domain-containing protein n=1 Tax=Homoserinimonas hongtaonis TaxID=2079791 RepID=A0A2U1T121_9MICO|nr:CPBP family intramembrane glutamic endopeptidase [Salinibacterium hongtaonis]PWB97584.1 CPBP family intramembrane metalloprotease domain-containing protein [Salinibacterium hongtaonis]
MNYAFHRLARSAPKYAWWKAIVTGLIALGIYVVFTVIITVAMLIASFLDVGGVAAQFETLLFEGTIDNSQPVILAFSLATVALMLPSIILARLIMGPRPLGLISSVAGRLRWSWLGRLALPAIVVFAVTFGLQLFAIPPLFGDEIVGPQIGANTLALIIVTLLLVPVQATAEEYVFRGYLMQAIGGWLKHPAWAILLPVPLFMAGHIYDIWGLLDVGVFAVFAGWLVWRTGGLEAAIAAHVVNNGVIFLLAAVGMVDANTSEGTPFGVIATAITLGLFSWWVVRMHTRLGLERVRVVREPIPADVSVQVEPTPLSDSDGSEPRNL